MLSVYSHALRYIDSFEHNIDALSKLPFIQGLINFTIGKSQSKSRALLIYLN